MPSKGETWSRGTNSCLPFAVNALLNLSVTKEVAPKASNEIYLMWRFCCV